MLAQENMNEQSVLFLDCKVNCFFLSADFAGCTIAGFSDPANLALECRDLSFQLRTLEYWEVGAGACYCCTSLLLANL